MDDLVPEKENQMPKQLTANQAQVKTQGQKQSPQQSPNNQVPLQPQTQTQKQVPPQKQAVHEIAGQNDLIDFSDSTPDPQQPPVVPVQAEYHKMLSEVQEPARDPISRVDTNSQEVDQFVDATG